MPEQFIPIVFIIAVAAVAIFRPLTKRIGRTIERSQEERQRAPDPQVQRIMQLMERLVDRMDRLEDRVDFNERVLERQRARLTSARRPGAEEAEHVPGEGRTNHRTSV